MANVKEKLLPYCGECGLVYPEGSELAARCCTCSECQLVVKKGEGHWTNIHKECEKIRTRRREAEMLARATKLDTWDGPVIYNYDDYYATLDDLVEHLGDTIENPDEWPEYVYVCDEVPFPAMDLGDILENLCENHGVEDFSSSDIGVPAKVMDNLTSAISAFNAATEQHTSCAWHQDNTRVVKVPRPEVEA